MNHTNEIIYVGADVSKDKLDCWKPSSKSKGGSFRSFPNTKSALAALLRWLPKGAHIIVEATGGYERTLRHGAHEKGIPISVVNPKPVRDFARAMGLRAKTDRIDAALLAGFGSALKPAATPEPDPRQVELDELCTLRQSLVAERSAHRCRIKQSESPAARWSIEALIKALEEQIARLEGQIDALCSSCPKMSLARGLLRTLPGVDKVVSAALLAWLPELGTLSRKQVAALAGLAPYANDSGKKNGKRFITGGRAKLRALLHMSATSIIRTRSPLAFQYKSMVARGKVKSVSLVAIARKLVIRANTISKIIPSLL